MTEPFNKSESTNRALVPGVGEEAAVRRFVETASKDEIVESLLESGRDPLTGLLNRRGLVKEAERIKNNLRANEKFLGKLSDKEERANNRLLGIKSVQVSCFDLSGFKIFNDTEGEPAGDDVLRRLGRELLYVYQRDTDIHVRLGGDEFVVFSINSNLSAEEAKKKQQQLNLSLPKGVETYMVLKTFNGDIDTLEAVDNVMVSMGEAKKKGLKDLTGRSIGGAFISLDNENTNV